MYKNINDDMIEIITNFLNDIKYEKVNISITPPHIEKICGYSDGTVYGKAEMNIHIEFADIYKKTNDILSTWEKVTHHKRKINKNNGEDL